MFHCFPDHYPQSTVFFQLVLYSACSWMWQIPFIFQVLKVRTLSLPISYTNRQAADQHPTFFYFKEWKKSTLIILHLILFSARSRHMTNIVHFSGLKVKIVKCDHSLSHTLFSTQQKCDKIHRSTLFWFAEWNSSLWLFSVLYSVWHAAQLNLTYIVHFFFGLQSKKSSLVIPYLILYSAHDKNLTYIVDFSSFQSEKSQLWSFFISYSIRHAAEVWHTSYIFWVWGVK